VGAPGARGLFAVVSPRGGPLRQLFFGVFVVGVQL